MKDSILFQKCIQHDKFASTPSLNYRGSKHYTWTGFLLTIFAYVLLGGYLIALVSYAYNDPYQRLYRAFDAHGWAAFYNDTVICVQQKGNKFNLPANNYIQAQVIPENTPVPLTTTYQDDNMLCVRQTETVNVPKDRYVSFVVLKEQFPNIEVDPIVVNWTMPLWGYMSDAEYTMQPYNLSLKEKFNSYTSQMNNIFYQFDNHVLHVNKGFFWQTKTQKITHAFASRSNMPGPNSVLPAYDVDDSNFSINFANSGYNNDVVMTNDTILQVLSSVGGLQSSVMLIIGFLFSNFFAYKYYENLLKMLRAKGSIKDVRPNTEETRGSNVSPSKRVTDPKTVGTNLEVLAIDSQSSGTDQKDEEEIQISLWAFFLYKTTLGNLLRSCCCCCRRNGKESSGQKRQVEILDSWKEEFDSRLDVVTVLGDDMVRRRQNNKDTTIGSNMIINV